MSFWTCIKECLIDVAGATIVGVAIVASAMTIGTIGFWIAKRLGKWLDVFDL